MNRDEIRARIAELEAQAEAQAKAAGNQESWQTANHDGGQNSGASEEPWPWEFLFEDPGPNPEGWQQGQDFSPERWLLAGLRGFGRRLAGVGLDDEFWGHLRAAEREILLAWQGLIAARLERLEAQQRTQGSRQGRQQIDIEFE